MAYTSTFYLRTCAPTASTLFSLGRMLQGGLHRRLFSGWDEHDANILKERKQRPQKEPNKKRINKAATTTKNKTASRGRRARAFPVPETSKSQQPTQKTATTKKKLPETSKSQQPTQKAATTKKKLPETSKSQQPKQMAATTKKKLPEIRFEIDEFDTDGGAFDSSSYVPISYDGLPCGECGVATYSVRARVFLVCIP